MTETTLKTATGAPGSIVFPINGARFCRVFWVVPSAAATLGENSHFVGHIFAHNLIALMAGATVEGQLMSQIAAVTLNHNTITNSICQTYAAAGGILTIFEVDSSGNPIVVYTPALSAAFNIYANSADVGGVNPPVQAGSIIKDTNFFRTNLQNGTYYVVEKSAPEGYSIDSTVRTVTISGGKRMRFDDYSPVNCKGIKAISFTRYKSRTFRVFFTNKVIYIYNSTIFNKIYDPTITVFSRT